MAARTPEQDEARRADEAEPAGSREVRRRLTFGVAGDLADMPAALSPWQRAYEAWRAAGLSWGHGAPPRDRGGRAAATSLNAVRLEPPDALPDVLPDPEKPKPTRARLVKPRPTRARPVKAEDAKPRPVKAQPVKAEPVKATPKTPPTPARAARAAPAKAGRPKPDADDVLVAGPPRPEPVPTRGLRSRLAVAVGLVLVAGGVIFVVSQGTGGSDEPGIPGPVAAGALFAPDPAATTDGLVQDLAAVASAGGTLVAAGTEGDGVPGGERTEFLFSADAGHAWARAEVRTPDGSTPPLGDGPSLVAGIDGHWAALGRASGGGAVAWTSQDARTWTRHALGAAFKPSDKVSDLTRTGSGFMAVGTADGHAVVWSSADGRAWRRVEGVNSATSLDRVASSGNVLLAHGTYPEKVTKKKGKKKVTRTASSEGLWRSTDGGRTWTGVTIPQAAGSYGATKGLVAGPGGFATVREGKHTTGRKKHRKTTHFGVLFTSADGQKWQAASRLDGYGIERFGGTPAGLAVLVRGPEGADAILRSDDGRTWRPGGTVAAPVRTSGLTVAAGGALAISGRQGDDAYLFGVDLRKVPGAVRPERAVRSLAAIPGRSVAVGSTNGGVAIWTAPDGRSWTRARFPGTGGWLSGVAHGGKGWLAVGRTSGASPGPLAMTSRDGTTWQKAAFPGGPPPEAVAAGPSGYVAVGTGAAWRSADLAAWERTGIDGAPADVTATPKKYVAVGGRGKAPAVWTSPDGAKWTPAKLPSGLTAPLTQVAAKGDVLVAVAANATALVSTDAGSTWARHDLGTGLTATAVSAAPDGFVVAAGAGDDAAVLTSRDGTTWRRLQVPGLSGPDDQRLTALTGMGPAVLATGTDAGSPILWRAPALR